MLITAATLPPAIAALTVRDPRLAHIVARFGPPPLWARAPGFPTLLHIILEQQVSLASARAAFARLCAVADPLTPERLLQLDAATLKAVGFSRQKARYGRSLAQALLTRELDLAAVAHVADNEARAALMRVVGIGRWTADIYLLMALGRPDIWPVGDRALATAVRMLAGLDVAPGTEALRAIAETWRPWRSVVARLLWYFYLSR